MLALVTVEDKFLGIVPQFAQSSSALPVSCYGDTSQVFTAPRIPRFGSASTHSSSELAFWQNSRLVNSGQSTVPVWTLGFRQVPVSINCLWI